MNSLINNISKTDEDVRESKFEENLFVKNIIVNKEKRKLEFLPYVPTEKWVKQLGSRLEPNF